MTTAEQLIELEARRTRNDWLLYAKALGRGDHVAASAILEKAAVGGHGYGSGIAGLSGFREWRTLADKLTVPASLPINDPLGQRITVQTGGGVSYWTGDGAPIPVSKLAFAGSTLRPLKCNGMTSATDEMLAVSPATDGRLGRQLARDLATGINTAFLSTANNGIANVKPASITFNLTPIVASGTTPADVAADLAALVTAADEGGASLDTSVIILSPSKAIAGAIAAPDSGLRVSGGTFYGVPVIATTDALDDLVLIDWTGITSGLGEIDIATSQAATLQMLDNPTNDSITPTATTMTSMFQSDSTAIRTGRYANWERVRDSAVWVVAGPLS